MKNIELNVVSVATAAKATGLSIPSIYQHLHARHLPAYKISGWHEWVIYREDLETFIKARAQGKFTRQWRVSPEGKVNKLKKQAVMNTCHGSNILTLNRTEKAGNEKPLGNS
jgi:excisionase family DNA binding protein